MDTYIWLQRTHIDLNKQLEALAALDGVPQRLLRGVADAGVEAQVECDHRAAGTDGLGECFRPLAVRLAGLNMALLTTWYTGGSASV